METPAKEQTVALMDWLKKMFSSRPAAAETAARNVGRNDLCWCGSGKKYKRCHLKEDARKRVEASYAAQFAARNQGGGIVPPKSAKKRAGLPPEAAQPPGQ